MKFIHRLRRLVRPLKDNVTVSMNNGLGGKNPSPKLDRLGSLLPYDREIEPGLFSMTDPATGAVEAVGYVLELQPQTGATPEMARHLTGLFAADLPAGVGLQVTLWADQDIEWATNAYTGSRTPAVIVPEAKRATAQILNHLAQERVAYLTQGTTTSLSKGSQFRVRHFRNWLAVSFPVNDTDLFVVQAKAKSLRERHIALLKTYFLYRYTWNASMLRTTLKRLLNPQKSPLTMKSMAAINPHDAIREQLVDPDTHLRVTEDALIFKSPATSACHAIGLSVNGYPSEYALPFVARWIGHRSQDIPCPFLITSAVSMPDFDKTRAKAQLMAARSKQIGASEIAHYLPYLKKREKDYEIVTEEYAQNGGLCQMTHQVLLFAPADTIDECIHAASAVFKNAHLDLIRDCRMHWQAYLTTLPMTLGPALIADLKMARRSGTRTITNAAHLSPFIAEFQGTDRRDKEETITPLLLLTGRHGQITPIDVFSGSGNFNAIIVGTSGSGKSALTNDLITGNLGTGGKTYVIDVGASYKKLCHLLDGQWIEFAPQRHLVINPFELIEDTKEDMGFLMPILTEMASPNEGLSDYLHSVLQTHVLYCLAKARNEGRIACITDLVQSLETGLVDPEKPLGDEATGADNRILDLAVQLKPFSREGVYGRYFDGASTVKFTHDFIVLELEGFKSRKALQNVVLLCLIFLITQDLSAGDKSRSKMVVIDEAWDLLSHKYAAGFIQNGYRRARKQNASFITITQSFADYYQNDTARAALENADVRFVLRQKEDSLQFLEKEKKVALKAWEMQAIKTLRLQADEFAECLFMTPQTPSAVLQIRFDPFSRLLYSSHAHDVAQIESLMGKGLSLTEAITHLMKIKGQL